MPRMTLALACRGLGTGVHHGELSAPEQAGLRHTSSALCAWPQSLGSSPSPTAVIPWHRLRPAQGKWGRELLGLPLAGSSGSFHTAPQLLVYDDLCLGKCGTGGLRAADPARPGLHPGRQALTSECSCSTQHRSAQRMGVVTAPRDKQRPPVHQAVVQYRGDFSPKETRGAHGCALTFATAWP